MDVTTVIVVAILINKSYSQVLSLSSTCFSNGHPLTLNCETTNVTQVITFYHDGTSKGSCVPVDPVVCGPNITQSGTTTSFTISSYDDATNSGNWTCEYGPTPSPDLIITVNPCRSIKETKNGESAGIGAGSQGVTTAITSTVSGVIHKFGHVVFTPPVARKWYFSQEYYFLGTVVFGIQFVIVAAVVQILSIIIAVCVLLGYAGQYDNYVTILLVLLIFVLPSLGVAIYWLIVALCCRGDKTRPETKSCLPSGKTVLLLIIVILPLAWFVLLVLIFKNHKDLCNSIDEEQRHTNKVEGNRKPGKREDEGNGKLLDKKKDEVNGKNDKKKDKENGKYDKNKGEEKGNLDKNKDEGNEKPDKNKGEEKGKLDKHKDEGNGKPDKNKSEENGKLDVKDVKAAGNQEQG